MKWHDPREAFGSARRLGGILLVSGLALGTIGCNPPSEAAPKETAKQAIKPIAVEIQEVKAATFQQTFEFPGVAQPIDSRRVSAESSGRILESPFDEGDEVKKGDLVLRVDAKSTGAQINLLKAQVNSAKREYNRIKMLAAEGLATPQQLDQTASQLEQANLGLKQARVGQSMSVVRSPFTGKVATKFLDKGEFAAPGQPVLDLIDDSTIKMEVTVPESAIGFVKVGDEVKVTFNATGQTYTGKVVRRGVMVTQPTQTFPIEIEIPNEEREIIPGMRARVIVPKLTLKDAIVVSRDALLEGVTRREAMVLKGRDGDIGKAELRVVQISEARGNDVVVTEGLSAGDKLIVLGHRNVVDGTPVRVVKERPAMTANDATPAPKPSKEAGEVEAQEEVQ